MFKIIYEDKDILVIDKNYNLMVNYNINKINLYNIIENYYPKISKIINNGIIHRIDKDTTGLLIIAKNNYSYKKLSLDFFKRENIKEYISIVSGDLLTGGKVDVGIIRNKKYRLSMTYSEKGKYSITNYRIIKRFKLFTLLKINILTGRTHQIRVHMRYLGYPIVGDNKYGKGVSNFDKLSNFLSKNNIFIKRFFLHSETLTIKHPSKNMFVIWKSNIPCDMINFIEKMKNII